ncbi:MAG: hypothetical protein IKA52_02120 [Bacteroidaceae bacterium]|nr:hypothetical protein [Bacteroidaceae bacterium]
MENGVNEKSNERGMELFGECLAGMLYSDEEIKATLAREDADEFIALRNELLQSSNDAVSARYDDGDSALPMAAEEESRY